MVHRLKSQDQHFSTQATIVAIMWIGNKVKNSGKERYSPDIWVLLVSLMSPIVSSHLHPNPFHVYDTLRSQGHRTYRIALTLESLP